MANTAPSGRNDYNTKIIEEFRANTGRVGGPWAGITLILVHHIGARSGVERVSPLAYSHQGDGRYAIWAANGGSPAHPNWYHNLKAHPRIKAEVGTQTLTVLAECDKAILVGNRHTSALLPVSCCPSLSIWPVSLARRPVKLLYPPGPLPAIIGL